MVECELPKLEMGVRFPSLAHYSARNSGIFIIDKSALPVDRQEGGKMRYLAISLALVIMLGCASTSRLPDDEANQLRQDLKFLIPEKSGFFYTVKHGDTLWGIAKKHNIELDQLINANQDVLKGSRVLKTGMRLFIPSRAGSNLPSTNEANFVWPLKGRLSHKTSGYGISIKAFTGQDVRATKSGVITFVSDQVQGYGKTIVIRHSGGFASMYAYNSENLVKMNEQVKQGQVIARAGKTGRPDEPRLYFLLMRYDKPVNPLNYLR